MNLPHWLSFCHLRFLHDKCNFYQLKSNTDSDPFLLMTLYGDKEIKSKDNKTLTLCILVGQV